MTAFARCGPSVQTTTSPPFFSLSRSASSSAYPSDSLTSKERSPSSTHFPSRFTRRTASLFGTCFIKTTIFIKYSLEPCCLPLGGVHAYAHRYEEDAHT